MFGTHNGANERFEQILLINERFGIAIAIFPKSNVKSNRQGKNCN